MKNQIEKESTEEEIEEFEKDIPKTEGEIEGDEPNIE